MGCIETGAGTSPAGHGDWSTSCIHLGYNYFNPPQVRFVMNVEERKKIVVACHKDATSGHMGTKKTLARITERFMWPGVAKDVYKHVSN